MPTNTYVALDKITLGSATNTVNFTSIPQTYTDLVLVIGSSLSTGGGNPRLQLNSNTGTNYSQTSLYGNGTSAASFRISNSNHVYFGGGSGTANTQSTTLIHLMNYSNTTTNKTVLIRYDDVTEAAYATVGMFRNTAAITSIQLTTQAGNFNSGSTFSLYGISAIGGVTPKATGGTVTSDANYWYHTFEMSGNFVPNQSLTCDYLVVAGGGGGGTEYGGGGGAGGFRTSIGGSALSLTAQSYPVTVGGGGAGGTGAGTYGANGSNSIFSTITSTGGGGGGANLSGSVPPDGSSGGSGGGGGIVNYGSGFVTSAGGAGTAGQGNAGGIGGRLGGGGGGGAGATGANYTTNPGTGQIADNKGNGGAGTASSITGTSITYAGGGGGIGWSGTTTGGAGGGGNGAYVTGTPATAGTQNTGGGGGGGAGVGTLNGASGGSGVVIVRYAK
jgi:hypothetical protein